MGGCLYCLRHDSGSFSKRQGRMAGKRSDSGLNLSTPQLAPSPPHDGVGGRRVAFCPTAIRHRREHQPQSEVETSRNLWLMAKRFLPGQYCTCRCEQLAMALSHEYRRRHMHHRHCFQKPQILEKILRIDFGRFRPLCIAVHQAQNKKALRKVGLLHHLKKREVESRTPAIPQVMHV